MKKLKIIVAVLVCCGLSATATFSKEQTPSKTKKTQIVIIGGIHSFHHKNPKYSPERLKEIILSLKPDAILNELPLSLVEPNGRPIIRSRDANEPEMWAADQVAQKLGIEQIPFDRPNRQEHYRKTKKFQRRKKAEKRFSEWLEQVKINAPESVDLKITQLSTYCLQAQIYLTNNVGPEIINSDGYDEIVRIRHILWKEIRPEILKKYPGYETLVEDYDFDYQEWQERNRIMADNIIKAAKRYTGKRMVVVTGAEHRYTLRDFLKNEESIDLKEYWEIIKPDIKEAESFKGLQEDISSESPVSNLTKREHISGLVQLWSAIKYKCAVLEYAEVDWDKILPEYFTKAEQAKNDEQYYLVLEEMIALVKDNHTDLEKIPGRKNLYKPNIYIEPIEGQYRITGFYDNSNVTEDIKIGDIIVAVDGKPVEQSVDEVKVYICASSEIERIHRALDRMLWRTKGKNVALEVKRGQKSLNVILSAVVPHQRWFNHIPRVFSHRLLNERYGYIRIQNFWDKHIVEDFTKALEQLKESEGLILDLRENGGGNEMKGAQIAGRLVQERIYFHQPVLKSVSLKIVQEAIDSKMKDANELKLKYCMSAGPLGPWQYDKPVVILVNWRTGSAAEGFTMGLKYSGRACVIGERTLGSTGNPYYVELPGEARGRICRNKSNRPDGSRLQGVGIPPDIPVKRMIRGIIEGQDEILEAAIKYLNERENR